MLLILKRSRGYQKNNITDLEECQEFYEVIEYETYFATENMDRTTTETVENEMKELIVGN